MHNLSKEGFVKREPIFEMSALPHKKRHRNVFHDNDTLLGRNKFVNVGELITREQGYLHGHGIRQQYNSDSNSNELIACVAGFLEQTNKFLVVRPMRSRYVPQVGHVIIGRVTNVGDKRWSVDIGSKLNAILALRFANKTIKKIKKNKNNQYPCTNVFLF